MSRQTRRAADLTEDTCVVQITDRGEQVRVVASAYTVNGKTTVVFADGEPIRVISDVPFHLATQQEVEEADAQADREAFAAALDRFADRVVQARLPVPHRDQRIHIGFDLDRDSDVQAWSRWLASNPQQGTSRLVVLAEVEGVEVMVRGPEGSTAEFGPDLADAPSVSDDLADAAREITMAEVFSYGPVLDPPAGTAGRIEVVAPDVEHRDSVGAFPVAESPKDCARCGKKVWFLSEVELCEPCEKDIAGRAMAELDARPKSERDGWSVSDGHRPPVDDEAMKHDRHSGEG